MRSVIAGVGLAPGEIRVDLGEFHPSGQGGFQLHLTLDGDMITGVEPRIGFMHRGAEKLFEVRDYRQIMMLANRHDWYAPFSSELGVALTLESAMGIYPPERATWIRMLLAEFTRISALIAFLPTPQTQQVRNQIADLFEFVTGNRVHPMYARVGGVAHDIPTDTDVQTHRIIGELQKILPNLRESLNQSELRGLAVLSNADSISYGTSGPVAFASGLDNDLRFDTNNFNTEYLKYKDLGLTKPAAYQDGDAYSRFLALIDQVAFSIDLIEKILPHLKDTSGSDINVVLPKVVRAPEGNSYNWVDGPTGINGWYLVSAGDKTPWRLKLRSASFNNFQALVPTLVGHRIDHLAAAISSMFFVIGDLDR
jgi:NADH-quinone oxidoreductase subunit D